MAKTEGITSRSFQADLAQDDLEDAQGYHGVNVTVTASDGGKRESVRSLPSKLATSPLSAPRSRGRR